MDRTLRVLIVEDQEDDAELVCRQLRRGGLVISTERVSNAEQLKHALDRQSWDIVLTDYSMPQFTGKMALEIVRARGLQTPFIIVSGSLGEDRAVEMMKAGAQDFFAKGNLTRLASAVEREVQEFEERKRREAEARRAEEERRRLLGELKEAVRARDTFLGLAAHELRTPLTSALLHLEHLRKGAQAPKAMAEPGPSPNIGLLARQLRKLSAVVDNLIEVASLTSGASTLYPTSVDLRQEVNAAVASLEEELRTSGSNVNLRAERPVVGLWDPRRIRTVLVNLLSNAAKYGLGRPIEIELACPLEVARLSVTDHGVGISAEDQARVFNRFEHVVLTHHHGGFGLGLWIARRIVEAHGGSIHLTSVSGQGSTFTVELPTGRSAS